MADGNTTKMLTAEAIQRRLGFSTIAMPCNEPVDARKIAMIRKAGIERIEICGLHPPTHYDYHDADQVDEITAECQKQGITTASVHGPNLAYDSPYEEVRRAVVKEALASARVAEEMGASVFVAHFNANDYSERTVRELIELLEGTEIKLAVENLPDVPELDDYLAFVDRIDCPRFGLTVDIGHTRDPDGINPFVKPQRAREVMASSEHRLVHLHLHDFVDADHYPPFDGDIQWDQIFSALQDLKYTGEFMFEAVARLSLEDTLKKTSAFPNEFALRYGN